MTKSDTVNSVSLQLWQIKYQCCNTNVSMQKATFSVKIKKIKIKLKHSAIQKLGTNKIFKVRHTMQKDLTYYSRFVFYGFLCSKIFQNLQVLVICVFSSCLCKFFNKKTTSLSTDELLSNIPNKLSPLISPFNYIKIILFKCKAYKNTH